MVKLDSERFLYRMRWSIFLICCLSSLTLSAQNEVFITEKQKEEELVILKAALTQLHPGLYRYHTKVEMEKYFADLTSHISYKNSAKEYFVLLSQFATKINCGHTYLNPWNQEASTKARVFSKTFNPFLFTIINKKLTVAYNLSEIEEIKPGDEILSINKISSARIIDSLLTVSRADGNNGISKKLRNLDLLPADIDSNAYSLFDIFFPIFFPSNFDTNQYLIRTRSLRGSEQSTTVQALSKKERQNLFVLKYGAIPVGEQNWQFKFLDSSTGYFKIGDFVTWSWKKDYKQYLDSVFSVLNKAKATSLILDVRENEGGDDDTRNELLAYIIRKPFGCDNPEQKLYQSLTISPSLLPYLTTWNEEFKKPKESVNYIKTPDGLYRKKESSCVNISPKSNGFKGAVYLLINAKNSSTTFTMADLLQTTQSATLIGEKTGGTKQGLNGGQFFFLHLPYSKFELDLPLIWQAPTNPRPDEGVIPDVEVLTTAGDLRDSNDRQLKKALSIIKNKQVSR